MHKCFKFRFYKKQHTYECDYLYFRYKTHIYIHIKLELKPTFISGLKTHIYIYIYIYIIGIKNTNKLKCNKQLNINKLYKITAVLMKHTTK